MSDPRRLPAGSTAAEAPQAPAQDPTVAWLVARADAAEAAGVPEDAVPLLLRAALLLRDDAARGRVHARVAAVHRDQDDAARATLHWRHAVEFAPEQAEYHLALGLAHAQQENVRAAVEAFRAATRLAPEDVAAWRCLGVALGGLGEDAAADEALARAQELAPDDVKVLEAVATQHLRLGRFRECGSALTRAGELDPDNAVVRRLAKETSFLVERAANAPQAEAAAAPRRLRVALDGPPGEVEVLVARRMEATGFTPRQVDNARALWRDYVAEASPRVRGTAEMAAAVEFTVARLDFSDHSSRAQVAARHGVPEGAVARAYREIVRALEISVFDRRYCTQPHPITQVGAEARRTGLEPQEVFEALLEDEYREYQEAHDRAALAPPRLGRDEFEDASVEYGSLLTREMMGLRLSRRERVRRRELERLLLVT